MATEYKIENRNLYIYLDGELDHHLAQTIKYQCDIILKSYPIKDIEFDFTNSPFIEDVYKRQMEDRSKFQMGLPSDLRISVICLVHQVLKYG